MPTAVGVQDACRKQTMSAADKERLRRWAESHPDETKESLRVRKQRWYQKHRSEHAAYKRAWRNRPGVKERLKAYMQEWRDKNRVRVRKQNFLSRMRLLYGITGEKYDALLASQGGVCGVCGGPPGKKMYAVDHDHKTGKVRGVLCEKCNRGLGLIGDTVESAERLLAYLQKHLPSR